MKKSINIFFFILIIIFLPRYAFDYLGQELVTNGTMEADSNWTSVGTPSTNERSVEQVYAGSFSRKVVTDGSSEGIYSDAITINVGGIYRISIALYPDMDEQIRIIVTNGDDSTTKILSYTPGINIVQDQWNVISQDIMISITGSSSHVYVYSFFPGNTFFVDNVSLKRVYKAIILHAF